MHFLVKKLNELPAEERKKALAEIISNVTAAPNTKADETSLLLMSDFTAAAIERAALFGKMQGSSSGYDSIDKLTKGFVGGELVVLAGKTSYGKTTLAMNIGNRMALAGNRVLFVTMEMTHVELTSRYMHINGGETEDYSVVAGNTMFQKNDELNWKSIDGLIAHAVKSLNIDLVIIDHLHYFTRELDNVPEDLGRITKEIKKNAIRYNLPVILISHVRKTQNDGPATMNDLRGSSYIAQDADIVLMVGREEGRDNALFVKVEKNRNRGFDRKFDTVELQLIETKITELRPPWNTSVPF